MQALAELCAERAIKLIGGGADEGQSGHRDDPSSERLLHQPRRPVLRLVAAAATAAEDFDRDRGVDHSAGDAADAHGDRLRVAAAVFAVGDTVDEAPERVAGEADDDHGEGYASERLMADEGERAFRSAGGTAGGGEEAGDDVDDADRKVAEAREAFDHRAKR